MAIEKKIIDGLERLSDVFKTLLLNKAKTYGVSPIQIQILLFASSHSQELCNVTYLSKEFNITKPTISDAVKSLYDKGYLDKHNSTVDSRSYTVFLTAEGKLLLEKVNDYSQPFYDVIKNNQLHDLDLHYNAITKLIFHLYKKGVIQVQRTCYACKFYAKNTHTSSHFCGLLNKPLENTEIKLDCPEFIENK